MFLSEAAIDTFLSKPVLPAQLLETLAMLSGRLDPSLHPVADTDAAEQGERGRILVVEDNPVNQLVAEGVLPRLGYQVVIAENGAAGVAAYAVDPPSFHAILMDCQMPVMNGYDATRAIRAMQSVGSRIPIIAMTAAAGAEERQRCLDTGMDDFLLKPVDRSLLGRTLKRWIHEPQGPGSLAGDDGPPVLHPAPGGAGPAQALQVLDRDRLVDMITGDAADLALVLRFVERFAVRARAGIDELAAAARNGEPAEAVSLAHALRGSAANVGLDHVARLCEDIELGAASGQLPSTCAIEEARAELAVGISHLVQLARDLTSDEDTRSQTSATQV